MIRVRAISVGALAVVVAAFANGCSEDAEPGGTPSDAGMDTGSGGGGQGGSAGSAGSAGNAGSAGQGGQAGSSADAGDPGPDVNRDSPELFELSFQADAADPAADEVLATQLAFLDTRVTPRGILVVYLHGAGAPATCGSQAHGELLAGLGFHVFSPCYHSNYGVGNCDDDIEGCRLEAFEGVDHHSFVDISPANSIQTRIVKGLAWLAAENPEGDWTYYLDGDEPRWSKILVSGISHGASSSAVIGLHRNVHRVVMLSGPLDTGQAWLGKTPLTAVDRYYALTHTEDSQHSGHLAAFEALGMPGAPSSVDDTQPPYGGSHRLISSAATTDGHGSVQAGGPSPKDQNGDWLYLPVWTYLYTSN